ncbi:MAG TPA: SDR family NAD(P)-dependent oxidoreductase [Isosphaeraceae bacterium]|jgi:short-subunit dehydrogenase|nr:SDR family NAD(P)-dependent oxidoreductase [Isosphaeraceae bacterium]
MSARPIVLLTGAAHGIGHATAVALARTGTPLGLIDRDAASLGELVKELKDQGATVAHAAVDVTDRHALIRAVADINAALGAIDVLVACAGIGSLTQVPQLETITLRQTLDVNLVGVAQSIEAVLPGMITRGRGHIVGVASVAGYRGFPWMISYSASKAALIAYLEAVRPGLRRRGVTVTTVCPGFVRTQMSIDIPYRQPVKMIEPEVAARYLVRAIDRRPRNCVFPWDMRIGLAILKYMPDWFFDRLMYWFGPRALKIEF